MNQEVPVNMADSQKKKKMNGCLLAVIIMVLVSALILGGCVLLGGAAIAGGAKKEEEKLKALETATPSDLKPTGDLADFFNLNSDHTDLQRDNKENEIKGKIVDWTLTVFEIQKSGKSYRIQTKSNINFGGQAGEVASFVEINARDQNDISYIENLKTGDRFRFKGYINGTFLRTLEIKPAILIRPDSGHLSNTVLKNSDSGFSQESTTAFKAMTPDQLRDAQPCGLSPYARMSKEEWAKNAGKVIEWRLNAEDVEKTKDSANTYLIKTLSNREEISCNVVVTADKNEDMEMLATLPKNSVITVRGQIANGTNSSLQIQPAILSDNKINRIEDAIKDLSNTSEEAVDLKVLNNKLTARATGTTLQKEEIDEKITELNNKIKNGRKILIRGNLNVDYKHFRPTSSGFVAYDGMYVRIFMLMEHDQLPKIYDPGKSTMAEPSQPIPFLGYLSSMGDDSIIIDPAIIDPVALARVKEVAEATADVKEAPADAEKTASGLVSKVLVKGKGETHPAATDNVSVHYSGWTTDGKLFDSSVIRGQPETFPLDQVIKGWTEGVQLMVEGEKRRFWIPAALAYGENPGGGRPGGVLVFDVELISIKADPKAQARAEKEASAAEANVKRAAEEARLKAENQAAEAGAIPVQPSMPIQEAILQNPAQQQDPERAQLPAEAARTGERYPETRIRLIDADFARGLEDGQLRYAINEMFARHGAVFQVKEINDVFKGMPWYHPNKELGFDEIESLKFTAIEKANLEKLGAERNSRKISSSTFKEQSKLVTRLRFVDGESNLRNGPGSASAIIRQPLKGESGRVEKRTGDWILLKFDSGETGWAHVKNLEPIN
jgi:hypothetical protein